MISRAFILNELEPLQHIHISSFIVAKRRGKYEEILLGDAI